MTERSNKKKYPLCAAALALAVLLAGCAPAEGTAVATAQPTAEPTEAPTPTPEPEMNPLTGGQGDYTNQRPVAVSIRTGDGSTPQWGIAAADVLIEGDRGQDCRVDRCVCQCGQRGKSRPGGPRAGSAAAAGAAAECRSGTH